MTEIISYPENAEEIILYIPIEKAEVLNKFLFDITHKDTFEKLKEPEFQENLQDLHKFVSRAVRNFWSSVACSCEDEGLEAYKENQIARS